MAAYDAFNPEGPTEQPGTGYAPQSSNWWEGPPPAGYSGPWPPSLPPGASYGPNFGQIIYGTPTPTADTPGYTPPTDTTTSPDYHPEYWQTPKPTDTPAPTPTPGTGGGTGTGGGSFGGGAFAPFPGGQFQYTPGQFGGSSSGSSGYPSVPSFTPPSFVKPPQFSYDKFTAPTFEQAQQTPGYEFRLKEGERALQNAAAGKGILRTGGTLKDLLQYGQNYATNAYNDVYGQKMGEYKLGLDTAFNAYKTNWGVESDAYQNLLDAAKTSYTGQLAGYQNQYQSAQRGNELDYSRAWDKYLQDYNMWKRDQEWKYNVLSGERGAGFNAASA